MPVVVPGAGLTSRPLGTKFGQETVTLTQNSMPEHDHSGGLSVSTSPGKSPDPTGRVPALPMVDGRPVDAYSSSTTPDARTGGNITLRQCRSGQAHTNVTAVSCDQLYYRPFWDLSVT